MNTVYEKILTAVTETITTTTKPEYENNNSQKSGGNMLHGDDRCPDSRLRFEQFQRLSLSRAHHRARGFNCAYATKAHPDRG